MSMPSVRDAAVKLMINSTRYLGIIGIDNVIIIGNPEKNKKQGDTMKNYLSMCVVIIATALGFNAFASKIDLKTKNLPEIMDGNGPIEDVCVANGDKGGKK